MMEHALTVAELIELLKDCDPSAKVAFSLDTGETVGYIDDLLLMTTGPNEKTKLLGIGQRRKVIFLSGVTVDGITLPTEGAS